MGSNPMEGAAIMDNSDIGAEQLDKGTVTIQKRNCDWFMSISKDKITKLSKLNPETIRGTDK
jgi:hypothetical protein